MSQHHQGHHPQLMMDAGAHLGGHPAARHMAHPGTAHYGAHGPPSHSVVAPLYPSMTPPQHHTPTHGSAGTKRSRPADLDIPVPGIPGLEQSELDLSAAYAQSSSAAAPIHHHHRLPDQGPPTKMMRREGDDGGLSTGGGGAPSVVGQAGMPAPAPRPRGPKLKFTPEDDQLLIDLKENKNLTWKQIADFFPGRSSGTLQVRYCTKLKAKTTQWTDETDKKLQAALQDWESEKWRFVSGKLGPGYTPQACQVRAHELAGGQPPVIIDDEPISQSTSPGPAIPAAAPGPVGPVDAIYGQHHPPRF